MTIIVTDGGENGNGLYNDTNKTNGSQGSVVLEYFQPGGYNTAAVMIWRILPLIIIPMGTLV